MKLSQAKVHFIGIGGIGMSGIAELLHNMGAQVTGSDLGENAQTERLGKMGVKICKGHNADNVKEAEVVVFSSAVKQDNPEYIAAKELKLPIIPRAQALAEIMQLKRGIAIGGSHGKTTTTSFIATLFLKAEKDPTIVVGGRLDVIQSNSKLGSGEWMIAEADESDGSFHHLSPEIAIITNIDNDHMDFYKDMPSLQKAFATFADRVPFFGQIIACGDDENVREALKDIQKPIIYYGFNSENDYQLKKEDSGYSVTSYDRKLTDFKLHMHGQHNALNALAAFIAGKTAGLKWHNMAADLEGFTGVDRRMTLAGEVGGIKVYDDYAHHPTEIKAVLSAFKESFPDNRLVVLFQPHRYSRTQLCWDEFVQCFKLADKLLLTEIYAASEKPVVGIDGESFYQAVKHSDKVYFADLSLEKIKAELKQDDIFITLGAGNIWKLGKDLVESKK